MYPDPISASRRSQNEANQLEGNILCSAVLAPCVLYRQHLVVVILQTISRVPYGTYDTNTVRYQLTRAQTAAQLKFSLQDLEKQ